VGTRNDDISLILAKAKKQGFLPDVSDSEVDMLEIEARTLYSEIAKNLPNTRLYVVNTWYPLAPVYAPIEDAHLAIVSAATNNSNVTALINPRGWITGTGKVGSTTGSGNADLFTTSDSIHPTQAGHDFLGYNVASAISATY
jgi:lysophospholipase L1-like esterase